MLEPSRPFGALLFAIIAVSAACSQDGEDGPAAGGGNAGAAAAMGSPASAGATMAGGGSGGAAVSTPQGGTAGGGTAGAAGSAGVAGGGSPAIDPNATLDIYFIDVEGGAATLLVTPEQELILVDAGNPGPRDPGRIVAVVSDEVGADLIDHMLVTHYDGDHVGGVADLSQLVPIAAYYDYGDQTGLGGSYADYLAVASGKRTQVSAGDTLELGGLRLDIYAAGGQIVGEAFGAPLPNPRCAAADDGADNPLDENGNSIGFVARFGAFDFLDFGDLLWPLEHRLACPQNLVGEVDLLQTTHHGLASSNAPQLVAAVNPLVAVTNNGPTKGNDVQTFDTIKGAAALVAHWQLHYDESPGAKNEPDARIANPEGPDAARFIRASVKADGSFTLTNSRTGHQESYQAR